MATTNMVKQVIDPKGPLKGKGGALAQWSNEAVDRHAIVEAEMEALAQRTRALEGRRFGLLVYKLRDARQLRWRFTSSSDGPPSRHATWERVEKLLPELNPVLQQWYSEANDLAQVLNHREQVSRYELKTIDRLFNDRACTKYRVDSGRSGSNLEGSAATDCGDDTAERK